MLTVWRKCFGGPKCGASIPFPAGEKYVPVSCRNRSDNVALWYVGDRMGDFIGELMGHYKHDDSGLAVWIELPRGLGGAITRYDPQADGEDDGN